DVLEGRGADRLARVRDADLRAAVQARRDPHAVQTPGASIGRERAAKSGSPHRDPARPAVPGSVSPSVSATEEGAAASDRASVPAAAAAPGRAAAPGAAAAPGRAAAPGAAGVLPSAC